MCPIHIHDGTETLIPSAAGSAGSADSSQLSSPETRFLHSRHASSQGTTWPAPNTPCLNWDNSKWSSQTKMFLWEPSIANTLQLGFFLYPFLLSSPFTAIVSPWRFSINLIHVKLKSVRGNPTNNKNYDPKFFLKTHFHKCRAICLYKNKGEY